MQGYGRCWFEVPRSLFLECSVLYPKTLNPTIAPPNPKGWAGKYPAVSHTLPALPALQ